MLESSIADETGMEFEKEVWNFQAFVSKYNTYAHEHDGWPYEENSDTKDLELEYQGRNYLTLATFAEARFNLEQRT